MPRMRYSPVGVSPYGCRGERVGLRCSLAAKSFARPHTEYGPASLRPASSFRISRPTRLRSDARIISIVGMSAILSCFHLLQPTFLRDSLALELHLDPA